MTTDPKDLPGGKADPAASGADDDKNDKQTVAYETHQKLLSEKKKEQEKRQALETELQSLKKEKEEREKKELEAQGNFKALLEQEQKKAQELEAKLQGIESDMQNVRIRRAILKHIDGKVPESAHVLLPLSMVKLGADGKPDEQLAKAAAQVFQKEHYYAIEKEKPNGGLPPDAPASGGTGKKISLAEWNKMSAADMKKNAHLVDFDKAN